MPFRDTGRFSLYALAVVLVVLVLNGIVMQGLLLRDFPGITFFVQHLLVGFVFVAAWTAYAGGRDALDLDHRLIDARAGLRVLRDVPRPARPAGRFFRLFGIAISGGRLFRVFVSALIGLGEDTSTLKDAGGKLIAVGQSLSGLFAGDEVMKRLAGELHLRTYGDRLLLNSHRSREFTR